MTDDQLEEIIESNIRMSYEIDSQPIGVIRSVTPSAADILDHIKLWYGGGLSLHQLKGIVDGDPDDVAYSTRLTISLLDKHKICISLVQNHELEVNNLMDTDKINEFIQLKCPSLYEYLTHRFGIYL
jgi:hypothetical protein